MNDKIKTQRFSLWYIKGISALIIFGVLFYYINPIEVFKTFSNITWELLVFLLFISFVLVYISVIKWRTLLLGYERDESAFKLFALYLIGFFVNLIFPSFLGGDAVRSFYLGKKHGQREALCATGLERYSGLLAMVILAWLFMWRVDFLSGDIRLGIVIATLLLFFGTIFILSPWLLSLLSRVPKIGLKISSKARLIQEGLFSLSKKPKILLETLFLSFLFHSITVVNVVACALAVGWFDPPIFELFIVLPIILLISAVPLTPQGLGVQEGAFVYFLTLLGASSPQALGISLILRAKAYILAMIGGVFWLFEDRSPD